MCDRQPEGFVRLGVRGAEFDAKRALYLYVVAFGDVDAPLAKFRAEAVELGPRNPCKFPVFSHMDTVIEIVPRVRFRPRAFADQMKTINFVSVAKPVKFIKAVLLIWSNVRVKFPGS